MWYFQIGHDSVSILMTQITLHLFSKAFLWLVQPMTSHFINCFMIYNLYHSFGYSIVHCLMKLLNSSICSLTQRGYEFLKGKSGIIYFSPQEHPTCVWTLIKCLINRCWFQMNLIEHSQLQHKSGNLICLTVPKLSFDKSRVCVL